MKNFKKKLMVLPLAVGSLFATTACSSDIKFNQKDLDAVMNEAQDYLEAQNNYSTEFARNYLIHLLATGREKVEAGQDNATLSVVSNYYDEIGNLLSTQTVVHATYREGNTRKVHSKASIAESGTNVIQSREEYSVTNFSIDNNLQRIYDIKLYDVKTKKYKERQVVLGADSEIVSSNLDSGDEETLDEHKASLTDYYDSIYSAISSNKDLQITMDTIDKNKVAFYISDVDGYTGYLKCIFENDLLVEYIQPMTAEDDFNFKYNVKINLSYNTGNFDVENVGEYTKVD